MTTGEMILTERLRLRPPRVDDADQVFARFGQDAEVCRYMSWTPHQSIDDTLAYLTRVVSSNSEGRSLGFLIFSRASGDLLGSVGGAFEKHRMQFGYCLARDAWGHGFATETASAFLAAAFANPELLRIQACCDLENRASARVLEKIGMKREGVLRRYMVLPNLGDLPRDVYLYAKLRESL